MEREVGEKQPIRVIGRADQWSASPASPDKSSLPPSETDGEHSSQNDHATTKELNGELSIDDAMSQGEVESVAASAGDSTTTPETSHASKKGSSQVHTVPMKKEIPPNETGASGTRHDTNEKSPSKSHHHRHHNFNEDTIKMLESYLQSNQVEYLDEDAIAVRILRIDRVTSERVRFHHDPSEDSEDENDAASALGKAYQAAEKYTLALDFYKKVVADVQEKNPETPLDKRTCNWLRKAMGLQNRNDLWETTAGQQGEKSDESDDDAASQPSKKGPKPRRLTRGMARSSRIRKQEERLTREKMDLDALMSAVTDLEAEFGHIPESTLLKKRKRQKRRRLVEDSSEDEHEDRHGSKHRSPHKTHKLVDEDEFDRVLIAQLPEPKCEVSKSGRLVRRVNRGDSDRHVTVRIVVSREDLPQVSKPKSLFFSNKKRKRADSPSSFEMERRRRRSALRKRRLKALAAEKKHKDLLFGVMDPVDVMKMDATDYVAESNYVSLGLLEWKRRQLWNPASNTTTTSHETYHKGASTVPPKLEAFGISVALPAWDTINPIPEIQRQPTTKEPPRRRHSDATYADWITKMINCLHRSGRSFAFYEFFYSDIDRGWYNVNELQVEAAKLGVPPDAKLTRKEWSLVRRSIKSRPRRFSRRFVGTEMEKLQAYRRLARQVQACPSKPMRLSYDVPAYIRVGATVTAFHSRFRVVFRGIVLAHDAGRNGYLVQFERQELGYQFCRDTEVASHGAPEVLVRAADVTLDGTTLGAFSNHHAAPGGLAYGTSYGPMYVDQLDPVEKDKKAKDALFDLVMAASSKPAGVDPLMDGTQCQIVSDILNSDAEMVITSTHKFESRAALTEKVAERETLVQLIGTIVAALKRKTLLLDAIEQCHKLLETIDVSERQIFAKFDHAFKDHYAWLHANLRMTNQSLESSLLLLQVMYSDGYSRVPSAKIEQEENRALEGKLIQLYQEDEVRQDIAAPWFAAMKFLSSKAGNRAASNATLLLASSTLQNKSTTEADARKLRAQYLAKRLSAACQVLLSANYCGALVQSDQREEERGGPVLTVGPMKALLLEELKGLVQMPIPLSTRANDDELHIADGMRFSAMKDLQESLSYFERELEATYVVKKVIYKNANI